MEILVYFYLVIIEESFIVEFMLKVVDWKKFFSLGMMGLLLVVIILSFFSVIVDFVVVNCYFCCGSFNYCYGSGLGWCYGCLYYCYVFYCCYCYGYGYYFYYGSCGYRVVKL